jgi:hypothetical protein
MFFEQFYIMKWIVINSLNCSNKFMFEQEKLYIFITKNYCVTKAFLALDGLPLFRFVPIAAFFASGGALQYCSLIDIPMTCLQMQFFRNDGQVQVLLHPLKLSHL